MLAQAQAAFNEPSSASIAGQLSTFWTAWNSLAELARQRSGQRGRGGRRRTARAHLQRTQRTALDDLHAGRRTVHGAHRPAAAKSKPTPTRSRSSTGRSSSPKKPASSPTRCSTAATCCSTSSPRWRNVTVTEEPDHTDTVSFGDAAEPLVEGTTVNWPQDADRSGRRRARRAARPDRPERRADRACRTAWTTSRQRSTARVNDTPRAHRSSPATTAATIAVAVEAAEVQASASPSAGGNEVALAIAAPARRRGRTGLRHARRAGSAATCRTPRTNRANLQTTVTAINDQRQSVSGVSLDEEMTNLISFQRGYQASARTLTAMDEMLETLIEHTGHGGAVAMTDRITPAMVTSSTLERHQLLAGSARAHQRGNVLRQDDPRTVGQPLRREPGDRPAEPARRAQRLRKQRPGRDRLGEHRQRARCRASTKSSSACANCCCRRPTAPTTRPTWKSIAERGRTADRKRQAGRQHPVRRPIRLRRHRHHRPALRTGRRTTNTRATRKRSPARSGRRRRSTITTEHLHAARQRRSRRRRQAARHAAHDRQHLRGGTAEDARRSPRPTWKPRREHRNPHRAAGDGGQRDRPAADRAHRATKTCRRRSPSALSNTDDTNMAAASIAYANEQAAYDAALRAGATIVQESLLNFLQ